MDPLPDVVRHHDYFNLAVLSVICVLDIRYLMRATIWDHFGTPLLGAEYQDDASLLLYIFTAYLLVDIVWIALRPKCTMASSTSVIVHHVVTLLVMSTPWIHTQFGWHLAVNILAEINTWFLTLRRNVQCDTLLHSLLQVGFYATWILIRLLLYPVLIFFYWTEFLRFSQYTNSYINALLLSFVMHIVVTIMSLHWTWEMISKMMRKSKSS